MIVTTASTTLTVCAPCADVVGFGVALCGDAGAAARSMRAVDHAYEVGASLTVLEPTGPSSRSCELCGDDWAGDRFAVRVGSRRA